MGKLTDHSLSFTKQCFIYLLVCLVVLQPQRANGAAYVTVKKDGGIDIAFSLQLNSRVESLVGGKIEELLTSRLQAAGIELHKTKNGKSTEYQFLKSYDSIQDLQNAASLELADTEVTTEDKWLYTRYDAVVQPKLNAYSEEIIDGLGTLSVPKSLVRMLMQNLALDFNLTLPYDLYGPNNASEQDGNTLTWHITMADSEPLRLFVIVRNISNIAIAGCAVILLLAFAFILFFRKRNSRDRHK
ncbi:hypothetical protein AMQ83_14675 [Paenibacillus riograndensis]|nr:hypothetical protein AMQ83_14675 [Paenibacillus riograndensis]